MVNILTNFFVKVCHINEFIFVPTKPDVNFFLNEDSAYFYLNFEQIIAKDLEETIRGRLKG